MRVEWRHVAEADKTVTTETAELMDVLSTPNGLVALLERDDGTFAEASIATIRCLDAIRDQREHPEREHTH